MTGRDEISRIAEIIEEKQKFLISSHPNPDGDAAGSQLALRRFLENSDKTVEIINAEPLPLQYAFLSGSDGISVGSTICGKFDACFVLDCGSLGRSALSDEWRESLGVVINIDHHRHNDLFGDINLVDTSASSTSELVYRIIRSFSDGFDTHIAEALYVGLVTDTGSFRHSNTSPQCLTMAADLIRLGVDPKEMSDRIYGNIPLCRFYLLSNALASLNVSEDGRISWMVITQEMYRKTGASEKDSENFADYPRSLAGVEVAAVFREDAENRYRISLRSNGKVGVAQIAAEFGGGGHYNAAGFSLDGSLEEVREKVISAIRGAMHE